MPILQAVGDWIMWAIGALLTFIGVPVGGVIKRNRDRTLQNKRQLQGDPDDPNSEGVLEIANDTREKVDSLERKVAENRREMREEHQAVMAQLEEIQGTAGGDEHFSD